MNDLLIPKINPTQTPAGVGGAAPAGKGPEAGVFDRVLREKIDGKGAEAAAAGVATPAPLKFSAHALSRIKDRSISMGGDLIQRLEKAVDTAALKGAKESLILSNDAAFIVSVKNKTVITVVDRNQMNGNVFTNIDSTVVI